MVDFCLFLTNMELKTKIISTRNKKVFCDVCDSFDIYFSFFFTILRRMCCKKKEKKEKEKGERKS